jgi:hypothetical protein
MIPPFFRKCDRGEVFGYVLEPQVAFSSLSLAIALNGQCKLYGIRFQNKHTARAVYVGGQIMPSLKKRTNKKRRTMTQKLANKKAAILLAFLYVFSSSLFALS